MTDQARKSVISRLQRALDGQPRKKQSAVEALASLPIPTVHELKGQKKT